MTPSNSYMKSSGRGITVQTGELYKERIVDSEVLVIRRKMSGNNLTSKLSLEMKTIYYIL